MQSNTQRVSFRKISPLNWLVQIQEPKAPGTGLSDNFFPPKEPDPVINVWSASYAKLLHLIMFHHLFYFPPIFNFLEQTFFPLTSQFPVKCEEHEQHLNPRARWDLPVSASLEQRQVVTSGKRVRDAAATESCLITLGQKKNRIKPTNNLSFDLWDSNRLSATFRSLTMFSYEGAILF